jgi:hypothetical protein
VSHPEPDPEERTLEAVDRLVRAHLERETARTDATGLEARIRAGLLSGACGLRARPRRWSRPLGWSLAAAAIVIAAFLGARWPGPAEANAATLLRSVRAEHAHGVDRCYRVHFAPDPRYWDAKKKIEGPSESVLWTRGDRFWSDCWIADIHLVIGREEDGTLWVSPSRKKGIRFAGGRSKMPGEVAVLCDINALTVPALLDSVLADFDLRAEGPAEHGGETTSLVWARLKPGRSHPLIATALLEIDVRTDALRRLVLWTLRDGRPGGTVTYTLLESARHSDGDYLLASHLDPDAEVEIQSFHPGPEKTSPQPPERERTP